MLFFSGTCTRCQDPFKHQLSKLYLEFISTQLIPKLAKKTIEYAEWWIFKPDSTLAQFIQENQLTLNLYFRPIELRNLIEHVASKEDLYERGNYDVIALPEKLKLCFNTDDNTIYLPDLYKYCLPHVNVVDESKSFIVKNELIKSELYVDSPLDIIYTDPSSKFWIPRQLIHPYTSDDNQLIFTWKELCAKFLKLITNPHSSIRQNENNIFFINDDSPLAKRCCFKRFHRNQIPDILKKTTKFLGKSNTVLSICSDLKFPHIGPNEPVVYWIEDLIMKSNHLTPYSPSNVYL